MASSLRRKSNINYRLMHEGESIPYSEKVAAKAPVLPDTFIVERLIGKKKVPDTNGWQYLDKWQDYDIDDCTWEPEAHLPSAVLDNYVPAEVDHYRISEFSRAFERVMQQRLKCKNPVSVVEISLDLFRYLFGSDTTVLCNIEEFGKLSLPNHWYYLLHKDGTGRKIKFPVKLCARLREKKIYVKDGDVLVVKSVPLERCTVYSCTEACSIADL